MGLLINQGKQTDDTLIEMNDAICQIVAIKLHPKFIDALSVSFKILSDGPYKNRIVTDTVTYDPNSAFSWKYTSLRRCVGSPYKNNEPENVDIEAILLNKCLQIDFSKRIDKEGKEWQNCKYKKLSENAIASINSSSTSSSDGWGDIENATRSMRDVTDEDTGELPF